MSAKAVPHVHKYVRLILRERRIVKENGKRRIISDEVGREVYKCTTCPTYKLRALVIGEISICHVCNEPLILDMENTMLKYPTHTWCRKRKLKEDA